MQIQNQTNYVTNFKARLFNPKGVQIKNPNFYEQFIKPDVMSAKGSSLTDIYVKSFKSVPYGCDFDNIAEVAIKNPLFEMQTFIHNLGQKSIRPYEENIDELRFLEILTGIGTKDCEILENKALYQKIAQVVNERRNIFNLSADTKIEDFSPKKVLEDLLEKTSAEEHGFSEKRINDFKKIADRMEESLKEYQQFKDFEWYV